MSLVVQNHVIIFSIIKFQDFFHFSLAILKTTIMILYNFDFSFYYSIEDSQERSSNTHRVDASRSLLARAWKSRSISKITSHPCKTTIIQVSTIVPGLERVKDIYVYTCCMPESFLTKGRSPTSLPSLSPLR